MSVQSFLATVETDVTAWIKDEEVVGAALLDQLWSAVRSIWLALAPGLVAELQGLLRTIGADAADGDLADIETAVLDTASADLKAAVAALGSQAFQALIAILVKAP
jgi:hypothetical protein